MKIISKQHDYYDRAMGHGQDEAVCYIRDRTELSKMHGALDNFLKPITNSFLYDPIEARGAYLVLAPFVIAFCGKLYRGIQAQRIKRHADRRLGFTKDALIFYSWPDLEKYLVEHKAQLPKRTHYNSNATLESRLKAYLAMQGTTELNDFLVESRIVVMTCFEAHERYWFNADVVAYCYARAEYRITVDDNLESLGFGHFFDAYSAYQEIDMYISGTLANSAPLPVDLTEKDRIAQHGFDKWSFRKMPSKDRKEA